MSIGLGQAGDERAGHRDRVGAEHVDEFSIPKMVEVSGPETIDGDALIIATAIEIVGSMKGLVHVACEMQQEFQGEQTFVGIGVGGGEFGGELVDLVDNTGGGGAPGGERAGHLLGLAETCLSKRGVLYFYIDEMPLAGATSGAIGIGVP